MNEKQIKKTIKQLRKLYTRRCGYCKKAWCYTVSTVWDGKKETVSIIVACGCARRVHQAVK